VIPNTPLPGPASVAFTANAQFKPVSSPLTVHVCIIPGCSGAGGQVPPDATSVEENHGQVEFGSPMKWLVAGLKPIQSTIDLG